MPATMSKETLNEYIPRVRKCYSRMTGKAARSHVLDKTWGQVTDLQVYLAPGLLDSHPNLHQGRLQPTAFRPKITL